MPKVSEHHGKQERECDNSIRRRIDFPVVRHTVRVDERLERLGELVGAVVGGRVFQSVHPVQDWRHWAAAAFRSAPQSQLDHLHIEHRDPTFRDQTLLRHVQVE